MRLLVALLSLALGACSTAGGRAIDTGERFAAKQDNNENYRLGIGDRIRIIVYKEDTLTGEFQVNAAGDLAYPLIGDVKATGETTQALAEALRQRLADGYLRDPRVSVEVLNFRPYFILGEVKTPGQYPFAAGLTAVNAIAAAQGFTPRAEKRAIWIRQSGSDEEKLYKLTPNLRIQPGDTIRLGERLF